MFRDMQRIKQLLSKQNTEAVLVRRTSGVLAVKRASGYALRRLRLYVGSVKQCMCVQTE